MRKRTETVLYNVLPKKKYPLENNQLTDIILDYKSLTHSLEWVSDCCYFKDLHFYG